MALYVRHVHDNMEQWGSMAREQHNLGNKNGIFSKKKKLFAGRLVMYHWFFPSTSTLDVCLYWWVCVYVKSHLNHLFYFWLFYSSHLAIQLDFFLHHESQIKKPFRDFLSLSPSLACFICLCRGKALGNLFSLWLHRKLTSNERKYEMMRWKSAPNHQARRMINIGTDYSGTQLCNCLYVLLRLSDN